MEISRANILQKYRLTPDARLSAGTEAEVYAYGADSVLKLYAGTASMADLQLLQGFYSALDRQHVPFGLPRIDAIDQEGPILITIEPRLAGVQMSALLPDLSTAEMDEMIQRYFSAALAVADIPVPPGLDRYKLFDPTGLSDPARGDWHGFLASFIEHRLVELAPYLGRDVAGFAAKLGQLDAILAQPYRGGRRLIHGDFFPGNLLVDAQHKVAALLDFGLLTMAGDHLFDLATAWVFFDMYDDLHANLRERCLAALLERVGKQARGKLYRYVLIYSILSANTYSPACADGHYQWCVANLNTPAYWQGIE